MSVRFITKDGRKIPIKIATGEIHDSPRMIKKAKRLEHHKAKQLKDFKRKQLINQHQKENVHESVAHIMRMFPEGIAKVEKIEKEMDSNREDNRFRIEVKGGMIVGDFKNLKKHGVDVGSFNATKEGNVSFEVDFPENLVTSSPKKEKKVEFGMKNLGLPHIKKGIMEISSGNVNETEQEMLRMQFDAKAEGKELTTKQKKRIAEIERMADPHEIGNAPSPFGDKFG